MVQTIDRVDVMEARLLIQCAEMLEMEVPYDLVQLAYTEPWIRPDDKPGYVHRLLTEV